MSAYGNISRGFAGMKAESYQFVETIKSGVVKDTNDIDFGKPCFSYLGDDVNIWNYYLDTATLVFDADFVASNSIVITVNTVDTAAVVFATDHDTTTAAVVAAIKAIEITDANGDTINPDCVLDSTDTNNRTFLIRAKGNNITVSEAITGGGSQATGTVTYQSDQVFKGLARHYAKETQTKVSGVNNTKYEQYDSISLVERGIYYGVINNVTILNEQICYLDNSGAGVGNFTNVSGDTINCRFRSDNFANSDLSQYLAAIELNGVYKMNAQIAWS